MLKVTYPTPCATEVALVDVLITETADFHRISLYYKYFEDQVWWPDRAQSIGAVIKVRCRHAVHKHVAR
jgi:hypothetical protein